MAAMKGSSGKDLNLLSEQLGKDAVSRVHRLELENQRLLQVRIRPFYHCEKD